MSLRFHQVDAFTDNPFAGNPAVVYRLDQWLDDALMQQIADTTGGRHFNVPGGGTIEEYEAQLKDVFREIAADRPLRLLPAVSGVE